MKASKLLTSALLALFALVLAGTPAAAQWQVPSHAVPLGRGANGSGFHYAAPGAAGTVLGSNGADQDPSFRAIPGTGTLSQLICGSGLSGGTITTTGTCSVTSPITTPVSVTSTGSTTARTLSARFAEQFDALDYGGVCDGTTNTASAFNATVTAAQAAGGGRVILPAGNCIIGSSIAWGGTAPVLVAGSGVNVTTISPTGNITAFNIGTDTVQAFYPVIQDLGIQWSGTVTSSARCVYLNHAVQALLNHVNCAGVGTGYELQSTVYTTLLNFTMGGVASTGSDKGVYIHGDAFGGATLHHPIGLNVQGMQVNGPAGGAFTTAGMEITGCEECGFSDDYFGGNLGPDLLVFNDTNNYNILNLAFDDDYFDFVGPGTTTCAVQFTSNNTNGISETAFTNSRAVGENNGGTNKGLCVGGSNNTVNDFKVVNNSFYAWGGNGVQITTGSDYLFSNNVVRDNGTATPSPGMYFGGNASHVVLTGNRSHGASQTFGITLDGTSTNALDYLTAIGNDVTGNTSGGIQDATKTTGAIHKMLVDNPGFNTASAVATPSVPTTTTTLTNPYGRYATVAVSGGTCTLISVNGQGQVSGTCTGQFELGPQDTITLAYSSAPTWIWWLH